MYESDDEQSKREFYYHESNNNRKTTLKMTNLLYVTLYVCKVCCLKSHIINLLSLD